MRARAIRTCLLFGGACAAWMVPSGCSTPPRADTRSAEQRFEDLEELLLRTEDLALAFTVESHGAFSIRAQGTLVLRGEDVELAFAGRFAGDERRGLLHGDATQMTVDTDGPDLERAAPPALREGIVLGLTRMGLLHNLFALSSGGPPDGIDGAAREWVQVRDVTTDDAGDLVFTIFVSDTRSASATLSIDPQTGLPRRRVQRVLFGEGQVMEVVETYERTSVHPAETSTPTPSRT